MVMEDLKQALFKEYCDDDENELKCNICRKCLSVSPVLFNDIHGNICGRSRCNSVAQVKGNNYEQVAYQSLAKYLIFPCMYSDNGCEAELKWSEVLQHEETCEFKNFQCPFSNILFLRSNDSKCSWHGDCSEFSDHVVEAHSDHIFTDGMTVDLANARTLTGDIYFTKILEDIVAFIFYNKKNSFHNQIETSILSCNVWAGFTLFNNLKYQIKIFNHSGTNFTSLRKRNVELLTPNFLTKQNGKNWTKIDLDYINDFIENPSFFTIEFDYNDFKFSVNQSLSNCPNLEDTFLSSELRDAKCDYCIEELIPPVFMCLFAHNICKNCKKTEYCPKCSSKLAKSRNMAFEKLKFMVEQPCKNYSRGCLYRGPYPSIKEHEEFCYLNPQKCILGCSQEFESLLLHLKIEHALSISALDVLYNMNRLKLHVFLFDNKIFLFKKTFAVDCGFSFQIQCLGMREVRYKYELHLICDKFFGSGLTLSNLCHPELLDLKKHESAEVSGLSNIIKIPYAEVIEQMFPDLRNLKFKLCIFKIGEKIEK